MMSEFSSVQADELVTRQFLRAELALTRGEVEELRTEMEAEFHQQTIQLYTALGVAAAILGTVIRLG